MCGAAATGVPGDTTVRSRRSGPTIRAKGLIDRSLCQLGPKSFHLRHRKIPTSGIRPCSQSRCRLQRGMVPAERPPIRTV